MRVPIDTGTVRFAVARTRNGSQLYECILKQDDMSGPKSGGPTLKRGRLCLVNERSGARDGEQRTTRDLELEHSELRDDIDVVRSYGDAHPDAWVDFWIENEPTVRIVTVFAGRDVDGHEATLRNLVAYPDKLEVRRSNLRPRAYLEEIAAVVRDLATTTERGSFRSWGIGHGKLNVVVRASRPDLALRLFDSYGDAVRLRVGFLSYPDPMSMDTDGPQSSAPIPARPPLLPVGEVRVSVDDGLEVRSGGDLRSTLHLKNIGPNEIVVLTNGAVTARIVDPQTEASVGGYEFAQTLMGIQFRISPRDWVDVPLLVGTASSNPLLGYCVPSGLWTIEVLVTLEDRGTFRTPLLPISVTA